MRRASGISLTAAAIAAAAALAMAAPAAAAGPGPVAGPATNISQSCSGQNAEVENATYGQYVYEAWIGCQGIGFARSADGGRTFSAPVTMPMSKGDSWDPAVAVAPDGTLYVSYMIAANSYMHPVVAASFDHGATFGQVSSLIPPVRGNWGDRAFIAAGRHGTVYVTWDYGPSASEIKIVCGSGGSCAFSKGDLNGVIQKSTDGGRTWGPITPLGPGFPGQGTDSAPVVVEPSGRIDVLQWCHRLTGSTYVVHPGHECFTSSADGGKTWSPEVMVHPEAGSIAVPTWWIDGALGVDAAGILYAAWDTQAPDGTDTGWLSYSTDHGRTWSAPLRVNPDTDSAMHLLAVTGAGPGMAYVPWLSDNSPQGYALYLRPFSVTRGWLSGPVQVSRHYGSSTVWPGDTIGSSLLGPSTLALSWGSAVGQPDDEIYAADVTLPRLP